MQEKNKLALLKLKVLDKVHSERRAPKRAIWLIMALMRRADTRRKRLRTPTEDIVCAALEFHTAAGAPERHLATPEPRTLWVLPHTSHSNGVYEQSLS